MTSTQALRALGFHGRAAAALADALDQGISLSQAAKEHKVDLAAVIRLRNKVSVSEACPCCGHVTRVVKLEVSS